MKIACIDVDHIFFLALTGEKILDENGEPIKVDNKFTYRERTFEESCNIADDYIINILNVTSATHYVGFFGGSSMSRKTIYPEYKANRKDLEPLKNLVEMKHYLYEKWKFVWLTSDIAETTGKDCIHETDDYVASFVKQTPDSFIISPDKDLLGLEGNHYNPKKNKWVYNTEIEAYQHFWKSMVVGDSADNIKGIVGYGEKAFEIIKKNANLYNVDLNVFIFKEYLENYKENLGIKEFYKNYMCLKIKDDLDVSIFTPIEWNYEYT